MPAPLTPAQLADYHRDGFVTARGLYSAAEVLQWKQLASDLLSREPENRVGLRVWMPEVLDPRFLPFMHEPRVISILRQIIGPDIEFLSVKAVFKNAATSYASPWHQDWFYWEGSTKISVWIALDDATIANGCLKFIPGTHKRVFERFAVEGSAFGRQIREQDLAHLPVVTAELNRGDAVFFHDLAVHSSHPNTAQSDRWSLISTYRDASVPDSSEVWKAPLLVCGESVNGAKPISASEPVGTANG